MILTLILIPLATAALLTLNVPGKSDGKSQLVVALAGTTLTFVLSIVLWLQFDSSFVGYQFVQEVFTTNFCSLHFGIDGIALYFVILTTFTMPIAVLASWENVRDHLKFFLVCLLVLESLLLAVFTVMDLMLFYIFFESVLIPLFLLVGIFGGSPAKVRAAFLLFLYTLAGSLFMLLGILLIYAKVGSTDFQVLRLAEISADSQKILWLAIFLSLAVKTPLLPVHIWLPRAHAEAPVAGSIVLAGLILKLATYGYVRVLIDLLPDATSYFMPLVQSIAVVTLVYSSLATLRQTDFKAVVAYSSVGHMAIVVLGLFSNTVQGIEGALLLSIAHGLVSPALFILVGSVLYDRFHTRVLRYYRGVTVYMPVFSLLFFLFTCANMAVPLSLSWLGETMTLMGAFQRSPVLAVLASSGIVLSAAYSIWLYSRISFGAWSNYLAWTTDVSRREFMLLLPLLLLTFVFGIWPNVILDNLHVAVSLLLYDTP